MRHYSLSLPSYGTRHSSLYYIGLAVFSATVAWELLHQFIARSTTTRRRGLGYALYFLPGSIVDIIAPITGAHIAAVWGLGAILPISVLSMTLSIGVLHFMVSKELTATEPVNIQAKEWERVQHSELS